MKIIPVLDLKEGQVVRGIAGRRHEYRPIVSRLVESSEPLAVARAFRERLGFHELYIADLDALAGKAPACATFAALTAAGCKLWVDAGLSVAADAQRLFDAGIATVVAGLETVAGPQTLAELCALHTAQRILFSLDLKGGTPLRPAAAWQAVDAFGIAGAAIAQGVRRLLVLDLARVGVNSGPGTEALCRQLSAAFPAIELAAGGGVRDARDLETLRAAGVQAALVASALHDGRLP